MNNSIWFCFRWWWRTHPSVLSPSTELRKHSCSSPFTISQLNMAFDILNNSQMWGGSLGWWTAYQTITWSNAFLFNMIFRILWEQLSENMSYQQFSVTEHWEGKWRTAGYNPKIDNMRAKISWPDTEKCCRKIMAFSIWITELQFVNYVVLVLF